MVAIVGAGITGLSCAAALGDGVATVVVDRVPVPGGVHGWEPPETRRAVAAARASRAELRLGVTALSWDGRELVTIGQDGVERVAADAVVIAAGARPLGRAELEIAGARLAGVVAATVACHLAENGLRVGRRPAVVGGGDWAERAVRELLHAGAEAVELLAPDGLLRPMPGDGRITVRAGVRPLAVDGRMRVERVLTDDGPLECDALVLAHGLTPVRNVEGAVWEGPRAVFAQPLADPITRTDAARVGADAAARVAKLIGEGSDHEGSIAHR